jgi:hypothetical protein
MIPLPLTPGLGYSRGLLAERGRPATAIVIHTTGGGILARFRREGAAKGDKTPHDTAVRVYQRIMPDSGHYVIGQSGEVTQVVPETHVARHVGGAKSAPYLTGGPWHGTKDAKRFAWWHARWAGLASPRDLAGGLLWAPGPRGNHRPDAPSCNAGSIGLEVVPPLMSATAPWSDECWAAIAMVVEGVSGRHGIPLDRDCVVTHSDAHPISRTTPHGVPWDTHPDQWSWERFCAEMGIPA